MELLSLSDPTGYLPHGDASAWWPGLLASGVVGAVLAAIALWRLLPVSGRPTSAPARPADVEQTLALTLACIDAGFITADLSGSVVRLNAVAERILGWTQAEARGRSYWEVFVREGRPVEFIRQSLVATLVDQPLLVGTKHRLVVIARDGTRTPVEAHTALMRSDDGAVCGAFVVIKDMTLLDQTQADMRRIAAIVESSNDAIVGKSLDGRITSWNRAASALFGYSTEEAIGAPVQMLIPPDRASEEMAIFASIVAGRVVPSFETVRIAKGNRPVHVSLTISPVRDISGNIVGGAKIARDLTGQLRDLAAIRESQSRLRFALDVAEIGDWDVDLQTGVTSRSLRHDNCFGYDTLQAQWSVETSLRHIHPDDRDRVAMAYRKALLNHDDWSFECRVIWPDGSLHWIQVHGSTRYEPGDRGRMLGIVIDVTERRLAEQMRLRAQRLENDNRQIVEANRLKSQFLANMSHELRSPLNAIIGFSDILHADNLSVDLPMQHRFIGHIQTSGRHLLQLINDVLDLAKVEAGKFEFFPESVNLTALIGEITGVLFTPIHKRRLALEVSVDPAVDAVVTDPARLKQMLYNYLSNAIKFTPESGRIAIRALADGPGRFRIEVEDTGVGILPADLPRLFTEFQQLDGSLSRHHQGTGLGLALTRRMAQAQGGRVGASSVVGRGSVFHLSLPMTPLSAAELADAAADGAHFLVIGDQPADQRRIAVALADCGHQVDVASGLEDAIRQASAKCYDALTLDLRLDHRHGLAALERIRRGGPNSTSPVVAMTMGSDHAKTAAFSITDMLAKPLRAEELASVVFGLGQARRAESTIMVIDDEQSALDLMQAALLDLGVRSVGFQDGREALASLVRHRPAAIILDLMMPGFDGFEVLDQLRATTQWEDIPVFVWTGMELSDSEYDRLALSANAILRKGGGGLESMLDRLRRWRPSGTSQTLPT